MRLFRPVFLLLALGLLTKGWAGTLDNPYPNSNYGVNGMSPTVVYDTNLAGLPNYRHGTISFSKTFAARNSEGIYSTSVGMTLYVNGAAVQRVRFPSNVGSGSNATLTLSYPCDFVFNPNPSIWVECNILMWNQGGTDSGDWQLISTSNTVTGGDGTNTKGQIVVNWAGGPFSYDGTTQGPTVSVTRSSNFNGNGLTPPWNSSGDSAQKVGSYVASVTLEDTDNFFINGEGTGADWHWDIVKASMATPTTDSLTATYGTPWSPAITGGTGTGVYQFVVDNYAWQSGPWAPPSAGSFGFYVGQLADENHQGNAGTRQVGYFHYTLVVAPAAMLDPSASGLTAQAGTAWTPTLTAGANSGSGELYYVVDGSTGWQQGSFTPPAAGSYTVHVFQVADANHQGNATDPGLGAGRISGAYTLTVTAQPATFSFSNLAFTYDGQAHSPTITASPPAALDSASITGNVGTAAGSYAVSVNVSGAYTGSGASAWAINKAPLTITANDATKVYGQNDPAFTVTLTGFVNGETTSVVSGTGGASAGTSATSHVGDYTLNPSVGTLAAANYSFITLSLGVFTITPSSLSVTANDATREYHSSDPAFTATFSGFVNGDNASVISGAPNFATNATIDSPVAGSPYVITPSAGSLAAGDYVFGAFNNGALSITPAPQPTLSLTATPNPISWGAGTSTLLATGGAGSGSLVYGYVSGPGTLAGDKVTPTAVGSVDLTAYRMASANYQTGATVHVSLTVSLSAPVITWPTPASITYGTPISATQLNATATDPYTSATVDGTFAYTTNSAPALGQVLTAGTHTLSLLFTPTASTHYAPQTASVQLVVNKADTSTTLSPPDQDLLIGDFVTLVPATTRLNGNVLMGAMASTAYTISTNTGATGSLFPASGASSVFTMTAGPGDSTATVRANYPGDSNHNSSFAERTYRIPIPATVADMPAGVVDTGQACVFAVNGPTTSTATFPIRNSGQLPLSITGVPCAGDFAAVVNDGATFPVVIAPGGTATIKITFRPSVMGTRTGTVTVQSNAGNGSGVANLTGVGLQPVIKAVWR